MSTVANIKDGLQIALDLANATNRADDFAKLIDTQQMVLEVLEENRQLRARVAELEDELDLESRLTREGLVYYVSEDDGSRTGPVCPACYKRDRIVVGVRPTSDAHFCPHCRQYC